ncbi:MAG: Abi family protein [Paludibacteraceae bacterium]|nr:Abi family protein [Paludibacteraceae bacterium]
MNYKEFENIFSSERLERYLCAMMGDKRKAMTLYRDNIRLSQEMYAIVCCFEVALRNAIDKRMIKEFGGDWLRDAIMDGGIFDNPKCSKTAKIVKNAYNELVRDGKYTHSHLLAQMEFGVWKYMFSNPQYTAEHRVLMAIFPNKPTSTKEMNYNNAYIFNELDNINTLRNRVAHHEPICFAYTTAQVDLKYVQEKRAQILKILAWMGINGDKLMYGLDHVEMVCRQIENVTKTKPDSLTIVRDYRE